MRTSLFVGFLFTTMLAGCATDADTLDPGESDESAAAGKEDSAALQQGQYAISPDFGPYWAMTLGTSNQLTMRGGCKPSTTGGATCHAIIQTTGHYRLTRSGANHYVRLYDDVQGGDLIARFRYTLTPTGAHLTDMADHAAYDATLEPTAGSAAATLKADIGDKTLTCVPSNHDPAKFAFSVQGAEVAVAATNSREGTYSVDDAKLTSSNLKLTLSNDVDGPLAEDVITLPLSGLAGLASGAASVSGTGTYSEQFDGTTTHYTVKCAL